MGPLCALSIVFVITANHVYGLMGTTIDTNDTLKDILCGYGHSNLSTSEDTTVLLSAQVYTLPPGNFCVIENVRNLTIQGNDSNSPAVIRCLPGMGSIYSRGFAFINAHKLTLASVVIENCGDVLTEDVLEQGNSSLLYFGPGEAAALVCTNCSDLTLSNVKIVNYTGRALIGLDVFGHSILNTTVISDSVAVHQVCYGYECKGSGMVWLYTGTVAPTAGVTVDIINSVFMNNSGFMELVSHNDSFACGNLLADSLYSRSFEPITIPSAGAISFIFQQHSPVQANIINSNFTNNRGLCYGAILAIYLSEAVYNSLSFSGCIFSNNTQMLSNSSHQSGKYFGSTVTLFMKYLANYSEGNDCFSIVDSKFIEEDETFSTSHIALSQFPSSSGLCMAVLQNVTAGNTRLLYALSLDVGDSLQVTLSDIHLLGSEIYDQPFLGVGDGLLTFSYVYRVFIIGSDAVGSLFSRLTGSIIYAEVTDIVLTGKVEFSNAIGSTWTSGAAMYLRGESTVWLKEPLNLTFCNNTAFEGGAIYSNNRFSEYCTFQYITEKIYNDDNINDIAINVTFISNKARIAGNSIYSPIYSCSTRLSPNISIELDPHTVYGAIFNFEDEVDNGLLEISSRPLQVCLCGDDPTNTNRSAISCTGDNIQLINTYPGKTFHLSVVPVDESFQRVYSIIYNDLKSLGNVSDFDWHLGYSEDIVQLHGYNCTTVRYTVFSNKPESNGQLAIYPSESITGLFIPVSLDECPPGFELVDDNDYCDCVKLLQDKGIQCNISDGTVTRPGTSWIGIINTGSSHMDSHNVNIGYSSHCPTRYCDETKSIVNVSNRSSLCLHGHTGVLCGQCKPGLSVTVGSPECHECSNWWLLTIPLYALLGIAIVTLLLTLKITVIYGTINGLIFYANLININSYILLGYKGVEWSLIFVTFLNLELSFPVCLYSGLNEINKSLLSIVFPAYIWTLALIFVYVSRWSHKFSQLTSQSAVPVLATLVYITYYKLLRFSVDGFAYGTIQVYFPADHSRTVWYYDGSIHYLRDGRHLVLFFMVLIVICVFVIPYGVILTGIRLFSRFRIVNKFRPLIDAYCAPYKDRYRFWFGARLWVLFVIYVLFAILRNTPLVLFLCQSIILTFFTLAQVAIMPFRSRIINWLDLFFMVNALILTIVALYSYSRQIYIASVISVSLAFVGFCCIIGYHCWTLWKRLNLVYKQWKVGKDVEYEPQENVVTVSSLVISSTGVQYQEVTNIHPSRFRDSILNESVADDKSDY